MNDRPEKEKIISDGQKKGGNFISALLKVIGILIIVLVILSTIPLIIPRFMNLYALNVVSGSMEPSLPVGSLIYVKETDVSDLDVGDIILYHAGNTEVVHRIVEKDDEEKELITKGDANKENDPGKIMYQNVYGKVVFHVPFIGRTLILFASIQGKIALLLFALFGAVLSLLSDRIKKK